MRALYQNPFRIYILIGIVGILGVLAGLKLPISLYPNSSKPAIYVGGGYANLTSEQFINNFAKSLENQLKSIKTKNLSVDKVNSNYKRSNFDITVEFDWGAEPKDALKEVEAIVFREAATYPKEIRDNLRVNYWSNSSGFIAISFFSAERDLDQLYEVLEPAFSPHLKSIDDAESIDLWNPDKKEVRIIPDPTTMASLGLVPADIFRALGQATQAYNGGQLKLGEQSFVLQMPAHLKNIEELNSIPVIGTLNKKINLGQIAKIEYSISESSQRMFKTNGNKSLILFANPKTGGNLKEMAEQTKALVARVMKDMPSDIEYRILVDPSEFIRQAVSNVMKEVFLAAGLAVLVLFLFIGNFKNTITAAIEIPISMIISFILMKMSDMNLNLISLGGLALSAGMNVDASVVVLENIFRHFEHNRKMLTPEEKLKLIVKAVGEVWAPILGSTLASLVVFLPLALTKDLTQAVLGDLALAVVYSHGVSAIVALLLVPTIRYHILKRQKNVEALKPPPLEKPLQWLEQKYSSVIYFFLNKSKARLTFLIACVAVVATSIALITPRLPKELVGKPDTEWLLLGVNTHGNTLIKQMEIATDKTEKELLEKFGSEIEYTFVQIQQANSSFIMARLRDKSKMTEIWKKFEEHFQNTPDTYYWVSSWNPAELPLPNPPAIDISIKGTEIKDIQTVAQLLRHKIQATDFYQGVWSEPGTSPDTFFTIQMDPLKLNLLQENQFPYQLSDINDMLQLMTDGKHWGELYFNGDKIPVRIEYPKSYVATIEDVSALPVRFMDKLLALGSLFKLELIQDFAVTRYSEGQLISSLRANVKKGEENTIEEKSTKVAALVADFMQKDFPKLELKKPPVVTVENAQKDLTDALKQLGISLLISFALIALILYFQFNSIAQSLIVLSAIPFGVLGAAVSLFVFGSNISLNSALGLILLNGIAVANSIILVDVINSKVKQGLGVVPSIVEGARQRLRPILITSLTTILGMLPMAIGLGDGGKILQPLGITVAGGLWISMIFTLIVVPVLCGIYFRNHKTPSPHQFTPDYTDKSQPTPENESHVDQLQ